MSTTNTLVETLKESLASLEAGLNGRKSEIEKSYKTAVDAANKSRNEALETLKAENDEVAKIKKAIAALGGDATSKTKTKKEKVEGEFKSFDTAFTEADTNDKKVYLAIKKAGSTTVKNLKVDGLSDKQISNSVNALRNTFGVVVSDGKDGKADLVKVK